MEEQAPQPSPSVQPVQPVPVAPEKKPGILIVSVLLIAILLVAGGVYAGIQIGKNSKLKTQISKPNLKSQNLTPTEAPVVTSAPTFQPEITPLPDETANWKTYRNEEYGFEFKYPSDWPIDNEAPRDESVIVVVLSRISEKFGREMIYVGVWDTKTNIWNTFEEFLNRRRLDHPIEDIVIGQTIKAKRIYIPQGQDGPFNIVAFEHMGKIYEFSATCAKESSVQYDQILSTFKFTE